LHFYSADTETTGRIIGFDFANATNSTFYVESYLEQVSQSAKFVGDQYIYTNTDNNYKPFSMNFANQNFTDISRITNIPDLNLMDQATGDNFVGCYGVDFSPVIMVSLIFIKYVLFLLLRLIYI